MSITLSAQQEQALKLTREWLASKSSPQVFYLGGFAGTGKTTIAPILAESARGRVVFCAFTGKAALMLRQRGCTEATTIHSAIYRASGEVEEPAIRALREEVAKLEKDVDGYHAEHETPPSALIDQLEKARAELLRRGKGKRAQPVFGLRDTATVAGAGLVVVDEASMVGDRIKRDLESFGVKILAIGDPFQLPPVNDGGGFTRATPDFVLTEIHRHARDSGILKLATAIREGQDVRGGEWGPDCRVLDKPARGQNVPGGADLFLKPDQIVLGCNDTRRAYNARLRQLLHLGDGQPWPVAGDRVICLRNEVDRGAGEPQLLNGGQWRVAAAHSDTESMKALIDLDGLDVPGEATTVNAHLHHFVGREDELDRYEHKKASEFTYAYAVTAHKAQGSQWPSVLVWDEAHRLAKYGTDPRRHLYTAVTRAQTDLTVVR